MPKQHRVAIYEYLFKEGVMVAKKDFNAPKHPELQTIPNLHVIKTMQSLQSKGLVRSQFAWRHYYWWVIQPDCRTAGRCVCLVNGNNKNNWRSIHFRYLENEGIEYLRNYLHLPPEIVPSTLKRATRTEPARARPSAAPRSGDASKTGEDRSAYRRAPGASGGADKKGDVGAGTADVEFVSLLHSLSLSPECIDRLMQFLSSSILAWWIRSWIKTPINIKYLRTTNVWKKNYE